MEIIKQSLINEDSNKNKLKGQLGKTEIDDIWIIFRKIEDTKKPIYIFLENVLSNTNFSKTQLDYVTVSRMFEEYFGEIITIK